MRNLIITLTIILSIVFTAHGQVKDGTYKVSVTGIPLIGNSPISSGVNGVALNLSLGYCFKKNTSLDLIFSYSDMNNILVEGIESKYQTFTMMPTFRQSIYKSKKENFILFGELGYALGFIKYKAKDKTQNTIDHERYSGGLTVLNVGGGCNYFIRKNVAIELYAAYVRASNVTSKVQKKVYYGIGPAVGFMFLLN